jgi:hypothetical protein
MASNLAMRQLLIHIVVAKETSALRMATASPQEQILSLDAAVQTSNLIAHHVLNIASTVILSN